jgi:hypothetical protein
MRARLCLGCGHVFVPVRARQARCRPSCRRPRRAPLLALVDRDGAEPSPGGLGSSGVEAKAGERVAFRRQLRS